MSNDKLLMCPFCGGECLASHPSTLPPTPTKENPDAE